MRFTTMRRTAARGRNGWFRVEDVGVWAWHQEGQIEIYVWSRRQGDTAPICLYLTPDDALQLAAGIIEAANEIKKGEGDEQQV